MTTEAKKDDNVVTEDDLAKSLAALEGTDKEAEAAAKKEAEKVAAKVEVEKLAKTVEEKGSERLAKALDVSQVLDEVVTLMGTHVDTTLETLAKSINAANERDLAFARIVTSMKKSIDDLAEEVKKLGQGVTGKSKTVTSTTSDVLSKGAEKTGDGKAKGEQNPLRLKKNIADGLGRLHRAAFDKQNTAEAQRLQKAITIFESAGQISDGDMKAALDLVQ